MSRHTDYLGEMPGMPISDTDVEALLTRREPSDTELLGLASALARIDLQRLEIDVEQRVGVFSLRAATLARQSGTSPAGSVPWWRRVRSKLVTSALSVFAVIGMAGVAAASNAAAPGDLLFGIDQALEHVGINDGGITERLEEAAAVADHGRPIEALNYAADAVSSQSPEAAEALLAAAAKMEDGQGSSSDVAVMLGWMATTTATGRDFGQGVAEKARQIGGNESAESDGSVTGDQGNPTGQTNNGQDGTDNQPGNTNGNQGGNGNGNQGGNGNGNQNPVGTAPGRGGG